MARTFISHSSEDRAQAEQLFNWLQSQGLASVFLDFDEKKGIAPGADWERTLYREISSCDAVIAILTKNSFNSKWCFVEYAQARALGKAIIPVIETPEGETYVSDAIQHLSLVKDREGGLERLRAQLTQLVLSGSFPWDGKRPPFPGLLAFEEADAGVYFGRGDDIARLVERLNIQRAQGGQKMVVVLGPSGAGKSSLLRAGLLPRLKQLTHEWIVLPPFRPQSQPLDDLAQSIANGLGKPEAWREWRTALDGPDLPRTLSDLSRDLRAVHRQNEAMIVVGIDQGEDLFVRSERAAAERFFAVLNLLLHESLPFLIVMTLRSDYFDRLQLERTLSADFDEFSLKPMPVDRWRALIEGPARAAGIAVDPELVTSAMADASTSDSLPLLAFTLRELYDRCAASGRMTIDAYRALGDPQAHLSPLENAVRRKADEVLAAAKPSPDDLQALKEAFIPAMVRVNADGEYVRRAALMSDLPDRAVPLIERLARARLLIVRKEQGGAMIEVAHEALLRKWPLLRGWLDEEREFLVGKEQLEQDLRDWERAAGKQKAEALLWGLKLARAQAWLAEKARQLTARERGFIEASVRYAVQRRRMRVLRATGTLVAGVCLLFAFVIAYQVRKRHDAMAAEASSRMAASETDTTFAADQMARGEVPVSLAYLADAMGKNPEKQNAMALAVAEMRNAVLPLVVLQHQGEVQDAEFSPDGTRVVTASADGTAQVWDASTGQKIGQPMRHQGWVHMAEFSPDGTKVVTASWDGTARLWDARTGAQIGSPMQHDVAIEEGRVNSAHFSADGTEIVTASWDHTARVWDVANPAHPQIGPSLVHFLKGAKSETVWDAIFNPQGAPSVVVTASADHEARLWDPRTGAEKLHFLHHDEVNLVAISPDGRWIATGADDGTGYILDARTFEPVGQPIQHGSGNSINYLSFSPDSRTLVTASKDNTARLWQVPSGKPMGEPMRHAGWVRSATFSRDGKWVVTASYDRTARVWDAHTGLPASEPMRHGGAVYMARFDPADSSLIVTASFDHTARIWRWRQVQPLPAMSGAGVLKAVCADAHGENILTVSGAGAQRWNARGGQVTGPPVATGPVDLAVCSADGTRLFTAAGAQGRVWNVQTGEQVGSRMPLAKMPGAAVFDARDHWLALVAPDKLWLWDAATGKPQGDPIRLGGDATNAVFSADGSMVATWSHGGALEVWSVLTGAGVGKPMLLQGEVKSAAFSPDGKLLLASSTTSHSANLWTVATGEPVGVLQLDNWVPDAEFSPDGKWVATASGFAAQVWNAVTGKRVSQLMQEKDTVLSVAFSPDSHWAVTASQDGVAQVWDAQTGVAAGKPMVHASAAAQTQPVRVGFTADGSWILTAWQDSDQQGTPKGWTVRVEEGPIVTERAPDWLIQLAEIVGGERLDEHGVLQPTPSSEDAAALRRTLLQLGGSDPVDRFGKWLATDSH